MQNKQSIGEQFYEISKQYLQEANYEVVSSEPDKRAITGVVDHAKYSLEVKIIFLPHRLKTERPEVFCSESWIKKEMDWHYLPSNGSLCWIHPLEWHHAHNQSYHKSVSEVLSEGIPWMFNCIKYILDRHWFGHKYEYDKWDPLWNQWSHGQKGTDEICYEIHQDKQRNWKYLTECK